MAPDSDNPDDFPDPLLDADEPHGRDARGFVTEVLRKAAVASLGAIFMTEEGVRSLAGQLKLPKEMLGYLVTQAERTKDEVGRVLTVEVRRFLQSEKLRDEFLKLLAGMSVEVTAHIRLVPDKQAEPARPGAQRPGVAVTNISARRHRKKKD